MTCKYTIPSQTLIKALTIISHVTGIAKPVPLHFRLEMKSPGKPDSNEENNSIPKAETV